MDSVAKMKTRNTAADSMRVISLCCIVLAHTGVQGVMFGIRNFDVVCMVVVSAMCFGMSFDWKVDRQTYISYVWKRVKRLLMPTWLFLTIYFSVLGVLGFLHLLSVDLDLRTILCSFLLQNDNGISYVWIVRVYLLLALAYPFFGMINRYVKNNYVYIGLVALLGVLQICLINLSGSIQPQWVRAIYDQGLLYVTGYGIAALVGLRLHDMNRLQRIVCAGVALCVFILFWKLTGGTLIQEYKYPPHSYFVAYGVFVSVVLYGLFSLPQLSKLGENACVLWISKNSFWIYLWHIVGVGILGIVNPVSGASLTIVAAFVRWLVCMAVGIVLTLGQNLVTAKAKSLVAST